MNTDIIHWPTVAMVGLIVTALVLCAIFGNDDVRATVLPTLAIAGAVAAGFMRGILHAPPKDDGDPPPPPPPGRRVPPGVTGVLFFVLSIVALDCRPSSTPISELDGSTIEAGTTVANDLCSFIEGIDDSGAIRTICATVPEIAQIVAFITMLRQGDAGAQAVCLHPSPATGLCVTSQAALPCMELPGTVFCATSAERAKAILFVTRARLARLSLDAGAP